MCVRRATCWFVWRIVRRGVTRHLRHEGTSCSPTAHLIFINILKGGIGRSVCWSCSVLVRAARCPSWCDTAPPARGNLLLAFGSFNFHKHLEGGIISLQEVATILLYIRSTCISKLFLIDVLLHILAQNFACLKAGYLIAANLILNSVHC